MSRTDVHTPPWVEEFHHRHLIRHDHTEGVCEVAPPRSTWKAPEPCQIDVPWDVTAKHYPSGPVSSKVRRTNSSSAWIFEAPARRRAKMTKKATKEAIEEGLADWLDTFEVPNHGECF